MKLTRKLFASTLLTAATVGSLTIATAAPASASLRFHVYGDSQSACLGQITKTYYDYTAQGYTFVEHSGCTKRVATGKYEGWVLFA